ncbi:CatB-related O-acetyltransferase [Chromobacterium amazonense]|uniref:CatB-related O-acetyltransferase n=1 Tax=Chromobacterium amazonense TaxID=1382803 RepID=A0ABU8UXA8_9NEIS|nr:CatB-related O-acetyltransferase [Chromobacterium amazonense]MDQ4539184.1 CatB-related O-acetyltransferase [Chromobacterium amazonense]
MLLNEKLTLFKENSLRHDDGVNKDNLMSIGVKIPHPSKSILFENHTNISSPVFGNGQIFFGSNSYMNDGGYIRADQGGVFIGRYCSIGRRITIGAGVHNISGLSSSPSIKGKNSNPYSEQELNRIHQSRAKGKTIINSDTWIGDGAIIMAGITLGVGCVVASNAVVTKDVPPYQIVGGVPAKVIGERFDRAIIDQLLATEWWEADKSYLDTMPVLNIFEFLSEFKENKCDLLTHCIS